MAQIRAATVVLLLFSAPLVAITPVLTVERFGVSDGLPSGDVQYLAQDQRGYLWVGTAAGLARYNGQSFQVVDPPVELDYGGRHNVQSLVIDREDRIWIAALDFGILMHDPSTNGWAAFRPEDASLPTQDIWSLTEGPDGVLWAGSYREGLFKLNPATQRFEAAIDIDKLCGPTIVSQHWVGRRLYLGSLEHGVCHLDADAGFDTPTVSISPELKGLQILSMLGDGDGLLIGTNRGLRRYANEQLTPIDVPASTDGQAVRVTDIAAGVNGELWLASFDGLRHRDQTASFRHYRQGLASNSLSRGRVWDLLLDRENQLWIATLGGGLSRLPYGWRNFISYTHDPLDDNSLSGARVNSVYADAAAIWVATMEGGLNRIDREQGSVRHFATDESGTRVSRVWAMSPTMDGQMLVGTSLAMVRYDPQTDRFETFTPDTSNTRALAGGVVDLIVPVNDAHWISAGGIGLHRFDGQHFERYFAREDAWRPRSNDIEQLAVDDRGRLWIAGNRGLEVETPTGFAPITGSERRILGFSLADENAVWTLDAEGVRLWQSQAEGWQAGQQILARGYRAIHAAAGALWLFGPGDLLRIDLVDGSQRAFTTADGLPALEFSARPPFVDPQTQRVYLGTADGLVSFQPATFDAHLPPPPVYGSALSIMGKPGPWQAVLDLTHEQRLITARFDVLSFAAPTRNRFRSRLVGWEPEWVETQGIFERTFTNLPAGKYTLQAQAANPGGIWSEPPVEMTMNISPPPWRSPLAYALYASVLLILTALVLVEWSARRRQQRAIARANERRRWAEQASASKSRFLAQVGHEIRTPLQGLRGMLSLLAKSDLPATQSGWVGSMERSGEMLLHLTNDLLDLSKIEAGKIAIQSIDFDLNQSLENAVELYAPIAHQKGLRLGYRLAPSLKLQRHGDGARLSQVLNNLISNAIKFTSKGAVLACVAGDDESITIEVKDTGVGIRADHLERIFDPYEQAGQDVWRRHGGTGLGLPICRQLLELMAGHIGVQSKLGEGSCFTIMLPFAAIADNPSPYVGRVVVTADDQWIRELLCDQLQYVVATVAANAGSPARVSFALKDQPTFEITIDDHYSPVRSLDQIQPPYTLRSLRQLIAARRPSRGYAVALKLSNPMLETIVAQALSGVDDVHVDSAATVVITDQQPVNSPTSTVWLGNDAPDAVTVSIELPVDADRLRQALDELATGSD